MTARRARWVSLLAGLLVVPVLGTSASADTPGPGDPTPDTSAQEVAEQALEVVEEIVDAPPPAPDAPVTPEEVGGRDLTLALHDLAAGYADLPKAQRARAARLLARPTDDLSTCQDPIDGDLICYGSRPVQTTCNSLICIHWVTTGADAIPAENDGPGGRFPGTAGGAPDYAEFTLATVTRVAQTYTAAGYRPVVGDGTAGGDARPDIYLGELSDDGAYGYCAADDYSVTAHVPAPSYCALDDDYAEFGIAPVAALRVTAAHEWFHAVQMSYDLNADRWMMEATATWIEDEVFDAINDNRNYLPYGPLARPSQALDLFSGAAPYGEWIFFRFLSERYPAEAGGLPVIVRDMWRRMAHDGGEGAANMYSVQAISSVLSARHTNLADQLAWFTVWNRRPSVFYDEGSAYRASPARSTFSLRPGGLSRLAKFRLNHLAAATVRFQKTSAMRGFWRLHVHVNLNDKAVGSRAVLTVKRKGQPARARLVWLNAFGNREFALAFGPEVQWVDVTGLNTSSRYRNCDAPTGDGSTTCHGTPVDDGRVQVIAGRATR
ncbi:MULTISPECIES: MXAN_6640 family putative metalloprotease [unclassified Nocardioides]|uniref:MXAN_6640 family putative metalloprotease n=1 Tax=unclassified Nocardioides TaxID=2615069 RepID=UPI00070359BB|nr:MULTISPECIES: MXAN_6640 family putative metalloprotease [unclassified Nocardioides]KRC59634.1 hypothetical protein ASE19_01010 [Nocardioides sp. Root79]KRC68541.1 hypothetical protein ASE20_16950 [Nocardioides sp. Root240]